MASCVVRMHCMLCSPRRPHESLCTQNPGSVKTREELSRLTKRLKTAEEALSTKLSQAEQRADRVAKLQEDLEKVDAGACWRLTWQRRGSRGSCT